MRRPVRRCQRRDQRGAVAVEFALLLPLLLVLVFGIITYGYMLSFRQAISQGAAEGARAAAVWPMAYQASQLPARESAAKTRISEALQSYGVSCASGATCQVQIVNCNTATLAMRCARVTVSYPYSTKPLTPKLPFVPMPGNLSYTATARVS